jgi:cytochrome c-type biogenesis protein
MGSNLTLIVAIGGGLLSFLSPCSLALVPAYLASLVGPEILEPKSNRVRLPLFSHSLLFVLGFSIVFVILGALAGWVGFSFSSQIFTRKIAGSLLIAFGAFMLLAIKIPWLNYEKKLSPVKSTTSGYLRSLLIGIIFAVAWTPCAGPILGGILALAMWSDTVWRGAYLLAFYSLGLGLPFLVIGLAFDFFTPVLKRIRRHSTIFYFASGVLLIITGVLLLTFRWWNVFLAGWWTIK